MCRLRTEIRFPSRREQGGEDPDMIGRAKGARLAEIMKATDWQAHSVGHLRRCEEARTQDRIRKERRSFVLVRRNSPSAVCAQRAELSHLAHTVVAEMGPKIL